MKKVALLVTVLVFLVVTAAVFAQDTIDPTAEPNFGQYPIEQGFLPDPFIITALSGGDIDASAAGVGDCNGFVTAQPDVKIDYTGAGEGIRFFFVGNGDATLIVADPSGAYICNDDGAAGLDPVVDIAAPAEGTYSIWIGSFNAEEFVDGYLMVTEFSDSGPTSILSNIPGFIVSFTEFDITSPEATEEASG